MKNSIIYQYLFIVTLLFANPTWGISADVKPPESWITVFVHGIVGLDAKTCLSNIFQFLTDHIANTTYEKTVEYMRADPFFTKNQAMQELGLLPIDLNNYTKGYASGSVARIYNHILSLCPIKQKTYYYTFGWSGLLSFKTRHLDAQCLYSNLVALTNEKKKRSGIEPKIRLIGYSHGANICLNLAKVKKEKPYASIPLQIDELILLGAPIQRETEQLIENPIFKKIYSFYSRSDHVQKKDMLSSQQLFSKRVFRNRREFTLPSSLTQIEIKILMEKGLKKKKKTKKTKGKAADVRKRSVVKGHSWNLKNMSPGHSELWFMAWTPRHYRRNFPFYPTPIVAITPYLIQLIETTSEKQTTSRHVVVDIRPDHNYMVIRHRYPKRKFTLISFLSKDVFNELTFMAMPNKPDNYTRKEHDKHRTLAQTKAHAYRKEQLRLRRANRYKKAS